MITERNTVGHTICAKDVLNVLPYADTDIACVLERGLKFFFGIEPDRWRRKSTPTQRGIRISA